MGKYRRIVLIAVPVAVVAMVVWSALRASSEPQYKGKPLSQWLTNWLVSVKVAGTTVESLASDVPPEWQPADEALREIGSNAVPLLLRYVQAHDSEAKLTVIAALQKLPFTRIHFVSAEQKHYLAAKAFYHLGARASPAVPELIAILNDNPYPENRWMAAASLGSIGPPARQAVPSLLCGITNFNAADTNAIILRDTCLRALGRIGTDTTIVVPVLIQCIDDTNLCMAAVRALGELHAEPAIAVPALVGALTNANIGVVHSALRSLTQFGSEAKPAIPALLNFLSQQSRGAQYTRTEAVSAIKRIDPQAAAEHYEELEAAMRPPGR